MQRETNRQRWIRQVTYTQRRVFPARSSFIVSRLYDVEEVRDEPGVVLHVRREDEPSKSGEEREFLLLLREHRVEQTTLRQQRSQDVVVPVLVHAHVVPPHSLGSLRADQVRVVKSRVPDVVSGGGEYKRKRLRTTQLSRQAGGQEEPARLNHVRGVRRRVVIVVVVVPSFEVREELFELERVHVRERVQQTVPVHHGPYRPRQNTRRSAGAAITVPRLPQICGQREGVEPIPRVHGMLRERRVHRAGGARVVIRVGV
mmetsp:Transcript_7494/g.33868  ORF Transcript_7494/g.33868 Transcript_7494/m.33868 type:complete len:258 (-) Transcript_7494:784-1557(-)